MVDVPGRKLNLGDVVRLDGQSPYDCATVKQLTAYEVTLFRPYVSTADFSYSGGVVCYIGIEEFKASRSGTFNVIERALPLS